MSLISDAIKAAQREARERAPKPKTAASLEAFFPYAETGARESRRWQPSRQVMIIGGAAIVLIGALAIALPLLQKDGPPAAPAPLPANIVAAPISAPVTAGNGPPAPPVGRIVGDDMEAEDPAATSDAVDPATDNVPTISAPQRTASAPMSSVSIPVTPRADTAINDSVLILETAPVTPPVVAPVRRGAVVRAESLSPAQEYGLQARRLYDAGDFAGAVQRQRQAIGAAGVTAGHYFDFGVYLERAGNPTAAEEAYAQAARMNPRSAQAFVRLAVVREQLGRAELATAALDQALRLAPADREVNVLMGDRYMALGLLPRAQQFYETALRTDSTYANAHYGLANTLYDLRDTTGAARSYRNYLRFSRGDRPDVDAWVRARLAGLGG